MMHEHHILASPSCRDLVKQRFPTRAISIVKEQDDVAAVMTDLHARSVMFCGRWAELSVEVSRSLADWALRDPRRGCGVYLMDADLPAAPHATPPLDPGAACVVELVGDHHAATHAHGSYQVHAAEKLEELTEELAEKLTEELTARLLHPVGPALAGLALTGHGAEYCAQLGHRWLGTYQAELLRTPVIVPDRALAPVVLLNVCSSLRLGDSCVPREWSLARVLHGLGCAVIGSFRNLHTSPLFGSLFARAVLAGEPLGRIVNHLNRKAVQLGAETATFQLLGDPDVSVVARSSSTWGTMAADSPEPVPPALEHALEHVTWLERLQASMKRWIPDDTVASDNAHDLLIQASASLARCFHAWRLIGLDAGELSLLMSSAEDACRAVRSAMLEDLIGFVQERTWLQSAYAPWSRDPRIINTACDHCGGHSERRHYRPFASHLLAVDREECDRCGTTREQLGDGAALGRIGIHRSRGHLTLELPPLPGGGHGKVFFHRMPGFAPIPWPEGGGTVTIADSQLAFRGRLTLVAASITHEALHLRYHTYFVEPGSGTACPAASSSSGESDT